MTVLDHRYTPREEQTDRRFARDRTPSMDRMAKMEQLRDRIESGTYHVDPKAVADAIVANPSWRNALGLTKGRQCS